MNIEKLENKIIETGNILIEEGLTSGTGGNISGKLPDKDWFYISPSGIPYSKIKPKDLVKIKFNGEIIGDKRPSIEHNLHKKIFEARNNVNAIVHTHSFYAKAVASLRKEIPPLTDSLAITFKGSIEVTEYARSGSIELANNVSKILANKNGVLVANHGAIGVGKNFDEALKHCNMIEEAAKLFIYASSVDDPIPLNEKEVNDVNNFIKKHYGQKN